MTKENFMIDVRLSALRRSKRIYMCKTPGMDLWVALQVVPNKIRAESGRAEKPYEPFPDEFPIEITCRCRDCRWHRIYRRRLKG